MDIPNDRFASNLQICYEILLYLASRMAKLAPGDVFEFITRDPDAIEKIPTWCDTRNFTLCAVDPLPDDRWRFLIQK